MWKCFTFNYRYGSNSNLRSSFSSQNFHSISDLHANDFIENSTCHNWTHIYFLHDPKMLLIHVFHFFVLVYDQILPFSESCTHVITQQNPASVVAKFFKSQLHHLLAMWPHASFLTSLNLNPLIFKTEIITSVSQA